MQIVLNGDVKKLGFKGEVVDVKRGFFRNFLYPNGLADYASTGRLKVAESRKGKLMMKKKEVLEKVAEVIAKLKGLEIVITSKAGDDGKKLYGSVTEDDILKAVKAEAKVELEKSQLRMTHFKEVGDHKVKVHLGEGLDVEFKVSIKAA